MAFNYSTTWLDNLDDLYSTDWFESTWLFTTEGPTPSPTRRGNRCGRRCQRTSSTSTTTKAPSSPSNSTADIPALIASTASPTKSRSTRSTRSSTVNNNSSIVSTKGSKGSKGSNGKGTGNPNAITDRQRVTLKRVMSISSVLLITIVIIGVIISWRTKKYKAMIRKQWTKKIGRFSLISFILAFLCFYLNAIVMTYFMINVYNIDSIQRSWLLIFGRIPYQIGRLIMEIFFILRLHFIFGQTANKVNKCLLITLIIIAVMAFIITVVAQLGSKAVFDWFSSFNVNVKSDHGLPVIATQLSLLSTMLASLVVMVVMYLYIKILYSVQSELGEAEITQQPMSDIGEGDTEIVMHKPTISPMPSNTLTASSPSTLDPGDGERTRSWSYNVEVKFQKSQIKIIGTITKNTVLGLIGLISTFLINVKYLYEWIADDKADSTLLRVTLSVDGAINIWCLYLIFTWTTKQYRILCFLCDRGMRKCCVWSTKKSVIRRQTMELATSNGK